MPICSALPACRTTPRSIAPHEYTASNGRFSVAMAPDDQAIAARVAQVAKLRALGEATVPTSIGQERATNLFMRADNVAEFARLRTAKDNF